MAKFCGKCGSRLDESTDLCPRCDADKLKKQLEQKADAPAANHTANQQDTSGKSLSKRETKKAAKKQKKADKKAAKKAKKKAKRAAMTTGQKVRRFFLKLILFIILLSIIAAGVAFSLVYFNIYEVPVASDIMHHYGITSNQNDMLADNIDELEEINLGEETRAKSQVLDTIKASESNQTVSEEDTAALFAERGFDASEVTTMYSMDGTYFNEREIDDSSAAHHPLYSILYVSADNYWWMVYCCNGEFSAYPISYVLSDQATCEVLVSETEYVMSYDSDTNCFYKIIPNDGECIIKKVPRIDSDTLDMLASGELGI